MKQLTPKDLNTLSKEDMAAMVLQMQTTINTLSEQVSVLNANKFSRKSEKLKVIEGQMTIYDSAFNEAEALIDENDYQNPAKNILYIKSNTPVI